MKLKHKLLPIKRWTLIALTAAILFSACKKEIDSEAIQENEPETQLSSLRTEKPNKKTNPFSYNNIKKAKEKLKRQNSARAENRGTDEEYLYTYLQFNPNNVSSELLQQLEADTTIRILSFPFANGEVYDEQFALDEAKANQLADGNLYVVAKKNSPIETTLKATSSITPIVLDELYMPAEEDTTLQFQAFREAGYSEEQVEQLRICLFKRPSGFVQYLDQETNTLVNVPGMQVWGLVFGIPIHTYTDRNGYYRLPWRFVAGTIMGTHAKNDRINIKPINTQGAWWLTIPIQFIVGTVHVYGWVGACQMRNDVNIEFRTHKQNRYWAQLMHSVSLHDGYCAADGIRNAPDKLLMYAHWDDNYGIASAPMLGHISSTPYSLILQLFTGLLNGDDPNNHPNIVRLLNGILPDITIKTGSFERNRYSSRLMQTAFHELGHASHFRRAGQAYWIDFIAATLFPTGNCGGYGCGTGADDGNIAVGESWAEFIGTNHALRNHPNGQKESVWAGGFIRFDDALEREMWFFNNWIPTGVYNDLMDIANNDPIENVWDRTGGLTIQQLYQAFGPDVDFMCNYFTRITTLYPFLNFNDVNDIFVEHGVGCL